MGVAYQLEEIDEVSTGVGQECTTVTSISRRTKLCVKLVAEVNDLAFAATVRALRRLSEARSWIKW